MTLQISNLSETVPNSHSPLRMVAEDIVRLVSRLHHWATRCLPLSRQASTPHLFSLQPAPACTPPEMRPLPPAISKSKSGRLIEANSPPPSAAAGGGAGEQAAPEKAASLLAGKRIVVCEDEGITLMQLRRALIQAGLVVVGTAPNGKIGVEIVLREHPDLVLMDIRMPVMNGIDAAHQIIASYPVCIVMLTAFSTEDFQTQAREAGATGYIIKPVTSSLLLPQLEAAYRQYLDA